MRRPVGVYTAVRSVAATAPHGQAGALAAPIPKITGERIPIWLPAALLCAAAIALLLAPVTYAAPSPSPDLAGILAPPPAAGYVEADRGTPGVLEGPFTAQEYASAGAATHAARAEAELSREGFVVGYGREWTRRATGHWLLEAVLEFGTAAGARGWERQAQLWAQAQAGYESPLTLAGVSDYFGEHRFDSTQNYHFEGFVMAKGNDVLLVYEASPADDLGDSVATQAMRQLMMAPAYTIPPSQGTGSAAPTSLSLRTFGLRLAVATMAMVALLALAAMLWWLARARRATLPASAGGLAPDGRYHWDGTTWRAAQPAQEAGDSSGR